MRSLTAMPTGARELLARARRWAVLLGCCGVVAAGTLVATVAVHRAVGRPAQGVDDADIFLVYAKHLCQGHGWVYNVGGERVEGFSSVLYCLFLSAIHALWPCPDGAIRISHVVFVSVLLVGVAWMAGQCTGHSRLAVVVALGWCFSNPGLFVWGALSHMETSFWALWALAAVILASRPDATGAQRWVLHALLWLIPAARPEGVVVGVSIAAGMLVARRGDERTLLAPLGGFFALSLFRRWYFGAWLPNTFYAKVSPDLAYNLTQGLAYALAFLRWNPLAVLALGAAVSSMTQDLVSALRRRPAESRWSLSPLAGASVALFLSPLLMGGDHFVLFRLYQPLWPLLGVWLAVLAARGGKAHPLFAVLAVLASAGLVTEGWQRNAAALRQCATEFRIAEGGREVGAKVDEAFTLKPSVGVVAAGGFKYTYPGHVYDLLGLNNAAMGRNRDNLRKGVKGHSSFSFRVFLQQLPDIVDPGYAIGPLPRGFIHEPGSHLFYALDNIVMKPEFVSRYTYAAVRSPERPWLWILGFMRNDFLLSLARGGWNVVEYELSVLPDTSSPAAYTARMVRRDLVWPGQGSGVSGP